MFCYWLCVFFVDKNSNNCLGRDSVYNNLVNSKLNGSKSNVKKLMWNEGKVGVDECEEMVQGGKFDLGVCADCVHFVDFHR